MDSGIFIGMSYYSRTPTKDTYFSVPGIWDGLEYNDSTLTEDGYASLRLTVKN